MENSTVSIFGNKTFFEILKEAYIFSDFKIKYYDDLDLCLNNSKNANKISIIFIDKRKENQFKKLNNNSAPMILVSDFSLKKNFLTGDLTDFLRIPFSLLYLKKKIITLIAKNKFKLNSLIFLNDYIIDKNERKIKKNNLELKLSEKEINFLVLFSTSKEPINRNIVLKKVWHYSVETETHTIETHIHRLRKKISEKFSDNNFIKNNEHGYYI